MNNIDFEKLPKNNFFFPLIRTLAYSIHGFNDIFARSFILTFRENSTDKEYYNVVDNMPFDEEVKRELKEFSNFTPSILSVAFDKKDKNEYIMLDINSSARNIDPRQMLGVYKNTIALSHMIIISSYENVLLYNLKDSEVLQFFRHIRNASAHNGKFYFNKRALDKSGKLKKRAQWKNFLIKSDLQGKKLFNESKSSNDKFWSIGDLVDFLIDFENHYPILKQSTSPLTYV